MTNATEFIDEPDTIRNEVADNGLLITDNRMIELQGILDEFEHECFMLRVEASETRAKCDVVRKSYERIRDEFARRIVATLGSGTLTAEQVHKVLLLHLPHREYYSVEQTDAWQEIADELNVELENRTYNLIDTTSPINDS